MPDKKFELGDYVEVKDRIAILYELYPNARLVTEEVTLTNEPDGVPRVMVRAAAYRSESDEHPGIGHSWLTLPGKTPYTAGSEVENAETSAWGRAIASLGILIDRSIASAQEVGNKASRPEPVPPVSDGLIGTATAGKPPVDMNLRQTPDGAAWGFKLKNGSKSYQALAIGPLADSIGIALAAYGPIENQQVTVWGSIEMVPWDKAGKPMPPFARIAIERIRTPEFTLPADHEHPEAESEPLPFFDVEELADVHA